MANNWFQFKQFRIEQDQCAMKVSTDACIQGAWAADVWKACFSPKENIRMLDIGTGTGLLALMLAQVCPSANIDAAELDDSAAKQAGHNFEQSLWHRQLTLYHTSILDFEPPHLYQAIISNPPFFNNDLKNNRAQKTIARHDDLLPKQELAKQVTRLLAPEGFFCVMYPASGWQAWQDIAAAQGLALWAILRVISKPGMTTNRIIAIYRKESCLNPILSELTIYASDSVYSDAFIRLLEPYYLTF